MEQAINSMRIAEVGDKITFTRNGFSLEGIVVIVKDESVIVELHKSDAMILSLDTSLTVVAHKNYRVISQ